MSYESNSDEHKNKLCGHWGGTYQRNRKYPNRKPRELTSKQRLQWGANISKGLKGKRHSAEHKRKLAEAAGKRMSKDYSRKLTSLEYALQMLLEDAGLNFEAQVRFGRYVVDAYVADRNLVFEADGQFWYWHKDKEREAKRDEYLQSAGIDAIIHLTDEDLDPWTV